MGDWAELPGAQRLGGFIPSRGIARSLSRRQHLPLVSGACKLFLIPPSLKMQVGGDICLKTDADMDKDVESQREIHLGEKGNPKVLNWTLLPSCRFSPVLYANGSRV